MCDARALTAQLGGRWHGTYGKAACPICQPEHRRDQDALCLKNSGSRLLLFCFKSGCDFCDIATWLCLKAEHAAPLSFDAIQRETGTRQAEAKRRSDLAYRLWLDARPIAETPAERYLRVSRGITCPLPATLRFLPQAWHAWTEQRLPALLARVEGAAGFAVHRTYLRADGLGKADVQPAKAMLGATAGGAVRLSASTGPLVVAEGIETALSLASGLLDEPSQVWAALSASNLAGLALPVQPHRLIIASDGDQAGHAAAQNLAQRAAALGWQIWLWPAPKGQDWNDVLRARRPAV